MYKLKKIYKNIKYSAFLTLAMFWMFYVFILGNYLASVFYMPMFQNAMSVPSS